MDLGFFPLEIRQALLSFNIEKLYEVRLRKGFPIKICYNGKLSYLKSVDINTKTKKPIICKESFIEEIINVVTERSIYAFNEQICKGYLDAGEGIRIGLGGDCVVEANKIITIKNFSSLNIRIPHQVKGCANKLLNYLFSDKKVGGKKLNNTLIISPPFFGKTTILKDLANKLNSLNLGAILIIDERGEFKKIVGENIDVIRYLDKLSAFDLGLRTLSPSVIITDEIVGQRDWEWVERAVNSGVNIVASCHAKSKDEIISKAGFRNKLFERYVVLKDCNYKNQLIDVFDGDFNKI